MFRAEDFPLASWGLILIFFSIRSMSRKGHHGEIYVIWYINSLFFLLFYGMGVLAMQNGVGLTEICGSYEPACKVTYGMVTNVEDELRLIAVATTIAVGPQLLTYFLSGLSGSASTPMFVSQIAAFAVWSFVKFAAGLGGILTAEPFAKLTVGQPVTLHEFLVGFRYTTIAFFYAAVYISATERFPAYLFKELEGSPLRGLIRVHRYFTSGAERHD